MSEVQALLRHYAEVRNRLQRPPNAVPDTGINLRRDRSPPPEPEPPKCPAPPIKLTPVQQAQVETFRTSFCRKDLTFKSILVLVAAEFGIEYRQIISRTRVITIVLPRQIAFYIAHKHLQQSLSGMGRYMGLDHTSVIHGRDKIRRIMAEGGELCDRIRAIEVKLFENYAGLTIPAINECSVEIESGPGTSLPEIFPVENSGGTTPDDPKEGTYQDVAGEVHPPTTAIREAPPQEQ